MYTPKKPQFSTSLVKRIFCHLQLTLFNVSTITLLKGTKGSFIKVLYFAISQDFELESTLSNVRTQNPKIFEIKETKFTNNT